MRRSLNGVFVEQFINVMDRNQCLHLAINGYAGSVN